MCCLIRQRMPNYRWRLIVSTFLRAPVETSTRLIEPIRIPSKPFRPHIGFILDTFELCVVLFPVLDLEFLVVDHTVSLV
ncbi:hypothetical protein RT761_02020 [Atribacter laminatus]|uniref:Uncharacterized protein n=1 Tax=Atribacter laminatus TaxID=2847778 RepID=A0A7T1AMS9_ATRLM|nr:hypothetical protein RT761_02020 [Atribacter laminatus]